MSQSGVRLAPEGENLSAEEKMCFLVFLTATFIYGADFFRELRSDDPNLIFLVVTAIATIAFSIFPAVCANHFLKRIAVARRGGK